MNFTFFLKKNLNKLPFGVSIGKYIAKIDYSLRPGLSSSYRIASDDIEKFKSSDEVTKEIILSRMKNLIAYAYERIPFYTEFYDAAKFDIHSVKSFEDISNIPIVRKSDFKKYKLEEYSCPQNGSNLSNTGGTSGEPFEFYISPEALGHEWAHLHHIWSALGFRPDMLKANFAGRSIVKNGLEYDLIRHSLIIDIYEKFEVIEERIIDYNQDIFYLHGYPSAIYEFANYCSRSERLRTRLKVSLRGVFFSSEYPRAQYRNRIEDVFGVPTQSFYGHTERCIMAYELGSAYKFNVLQSYGYAEVVGDSLIGTSYTNLSTPLIRYDTQDIIKSHHSENSLLKSFELEEGRNGEFVYDSNSQRIPLTGLLFGRHHKLFNIAEHVQVKQKNNGEVTVYYTTHDGLAIDKVELLFDARNVKINFDFVVLNKPYKTASGKVPALIS